MTGIPVCDASTAFASPPLSPWRPKKLIRPERYPLECNAILFLLAITQRRNLAKLTRSSERVTEFWASTISIIFFESLTKLLSKVTHGKASLAEKKSLGYALVALLVASEIRGTYVLQAVERTLEERVFGKIGPEEIDPEEIDPEEIDPEFQSVVESALRLVSWTLHDLPKQREHLRQWTRHWLCKLFRDSRGVIKLLPMVSLCALLSSTDLGPDLQYGLESEFAHENEKAAVEEVEDDRSEDDESEDESNDADGRAADENDFENVRDGSDADDNDFEDASDEQEEDDDEGHDVGPLQFGRIRLLFADFPGFDEKDMHEKLDTLACKHSARLFSSFPPYSLDPLAVRMRGNLMLIFAQKGKLPMPQEVAAFLAGNLKSIKFGLFWHQVIIWVGVIGSSREGDAKCNKWMEG